MFPISAPEITHHVMGIFESNSSHLGVPALEFTPLEQAAVEKIMHAAGAVPSRNFKGQFVQSWIPKGPSGNRTRTTERKR